MKKWIGFMTFLLLASCQQEKIGYVDNVKLMDGYKKKQEVEASFQLKSEAFTRKRDSISQAFQFEAQQLQTATESMPKDRAQEAFAVLQQKGQMMGQQLQQEEQQIQQMGQMKMDSVVTEVRETIQEYGAANGYRFIFTGGEGGSVLYGDDASDVTEQVLSQLNGGLAKQ
ncbi:MAG: OmpH family outer membrane protein [Robiginitalea sp.]|uniref:OmpH family outer membrane protein n=1 Tax=Robiginitalea sp. TaxID=1902411 RepID=UPI003C75545D